LGPVGAIAIFNDNIWYCPARDTKVVDTLEAGDGFAGGFLYGLSAGWSIPECLQLATYIAAEVVSRTGARIEEDLSQVIQLQKYKQLSITQFEYA